MSNTSEVSNHSDEISNSELVRKSQLGDKAAFEQLVIRPVSYTHLRAHET